MGGTYDRVGHALTKKDTRGEINEVSSYNLVEYGVRGRLGGRLKVLKLRIKCPKIQYTDSIRPLRQEAYPIGMGRRSTRH